MFLEIDVDQCMFHGQCAVVAPELFDFTPETGPIVKVKNVPDDQQGIARLAVQMCPARAIGTRPSTEGGEP